MLLRPGHWLGRGSLLAEGQSLGQGVSCEVEISAYQDGYTVKAEIDIKEVGARAMSVRIVGNDVGTYEISVRTLSETYSGTAKLDSPPNLGLLWNEAATTYVTFALFVISDGIDSRSLVIRDQRVTHPCILEAEVHVDPVASVVAHGYPADVDLVDAAGFNAVAALVVSGDPEVQESHPHTRNRSGGICVSSGGARPRCAGRGGCVHR